MNHMFQRRIGALTIGQSPRPDLISPLASLLPHNCEILQVGALDGLTQNDLPGGTYGTYPLVTRMKNGATVMVDESFIAPRLQMALDFLEANGAVTTLLLCAGTFSDLQATRPLYKPFKVACSLLDALDFRSIGLIAPVVEQETPIRERWEIMGWEPTVWTANLGEQDQAFHRCLNTHIRANKLDCIVLDYVGHPLEQVTQLQESIDLPIIDLGYLAMVTLANTL
jgi:protein AroM